MPRARRLVPVAALALIAGVALAGCRSAPGTAVYVGSVQISNRQIDQAMDGIRADVARLDPQLLNSIFGDVRRELIGDLIFVQVARQYATAHDYALPAPDYDTAAGEIGLPVGDPYVHARADAKAYQALLATKLKPAEPSDADLREVYDRAVAFDQKNGTSILQGQSFENLKDAIAANTSISTGIILRNALRDAVKQADIVVNPRYLPVEYAVTELQTGSGQRPFVAVALQFGSGASGPPVVDH
jgi:hypothetical protein